MRNREAVAVPQAFRDPLQLLGALFCTPALGFALFDRQLRYHAVNRSLASMNGVPAEAHLGKTLVQVLGNAAEMVELAVQRVFVTGETILNSHLSAELPTRTEPGHWIVNYFPIKSNTGKINQVSVTVLEITKRKMLEESLQRLSRNLMHVDLALRGSGAVLSQLTDPANGRAELLTQSVALLENCIAEVCAVSRLLHRPVPRHSAKSNSEPDPSVLEQQSGEDSMLGLSELPGSHDERHGTLSRREREIVRLLSRGMSNKEMAQILDLSVRTVETYRARIMYKLDVHSVGGLVLYAVRNNIVHP